MTADLLEHLLERRSVIPSVMPLIEQEIIWQTGEDHSNLQLVRHDYLEGLLYSWDDSGERNIIGAHAVAFLEVNEQNNLTAIDSGLKQN